VEALVVGGVDDPHPSLAQLRPQAVVGNRVRHVPRRFYTAGQAVVRERSVSLLPNGCDRLAAMDVEDRGQIREDHRDAGQPPADGDAEARVCAPALRAVSDSSSSLLVSGRDVFDHPFSQPSPNRGLAGYHGASASPHVVIALSTDCIDKPFRGCRTCCQGELQGTYLCVRVAGDLASLLPSVDREPDRCSH
jgi:hypothetical protein